MQTIKQAVLIGERALFHSEHMRIQDSIFQDGESPLKESKHIEISDSVFKWKYPLWYCNDVVMEHTSLLDTARSGIWYSHHVKIRNSVIDAPKTFRRSSNIYLENVNMPNALESLWNCQNITMKNMNIRGDYFGMNSQDIQMEDITITGNYCFDGAKNIEVRNATLISKDAFWNCENVVVYDSLLIGEYLGWNSKNITFINCTIESLQGMCYMEQVKLVNCKVLHTSLAFEYASVNVESTTPIDSVKNPLSGVIKAPSIQEIIMEDDKVDMDATTFTFTQIPIEG